MDPLNVPAKFEVRSFTHSWDNSDWSFGWGLRTPNLGEEEAVGRRDGTVRKCVNGEFLYALHVTFPLSLWVHRHCRFCAPSTQLCPTPLLVSSKFRRVPLGVGGWFLGYEVEDVGLIFRAISKISNLCGPDPPTSQTDRPTDDMQSQYRALHYSASRGKNILWTSEPIITSGIA